VDRRISDCGFLSSRLAWQIRGEEKTNKGGGYGRRPRATRSPPGQKSRVKGGAKTLSERKKPAPGCMVLATEKLTRGARRGQERDKSAGKCHATYCREPFKRREKAVLGSAPGGPRRRGHISSPRGGSELARVMGLNRRGSISKSKRLGICASKAARTVPTEGADGEKHEHAESLLPLNKTAPLPPSASTQNLLEIFLKRVRRNTGKGHRSKITRLVSWRCVAARKGSGLTGTKPGQSSDVATETLMDRKGAASLGCCRPRQHTRGVHDWA